MAGTVYTIDFADGSLPNKSPFQINPGDFDGPEQIGTPGKTHTSIHLFGQGFLRYGEKANENFLRLLENFASPTPPIAPTIGQLWFDSNTNTLKVFNVSGSWGAAGGVLPPQTFPIISATPGLMTFFVSGNQTSSLSGGQQFIVDSGPNAGTYAISSASGSVSYNTGTDQTAIITTTAMPSASGGGNIVSTPAPATPVPGQLWFNVVNGELYVWDGTQWSHIFSGTASGDIDMQNLYNIDNLPTPTTIDQAANKGYVDTQISAVNLAISSGNSGLQPQIDSKVAKAGDTMTGTLTFTSGGVALNGATGLSMVGGTFNMTNNGSIILSTGSTLTLGQDPAQPLQAATKQYVDNHLYTLPPATTTTLGGVTLATSSEAIAGTSTQKAITPSTLQAAIATQVPFNLSVVAYAALITFDFNASRNFAVTLTGNTAIQNPTNLVTGQSGV